MKYRIFIPNIQCNMRMIHRRFYSDRLSTAIRRLPVTALLGPGQCGKTTLATALADGIQATRFDLESQLERNRLQNPEMVLFPLEGLIVLDEIQQMPELFSVLRVLVDRPSCSARFLVLGSASPVDSKITVLPLSEATKLPLV